MNGNTIEAIKLTRSFGSFTAVEDIDLSIKEGEVFGFLGPNGAGKTTTVRMLSCLIRPTSGNAYVCGYDINDRKDARAIRRNVGILTENSGFYDNLSVMKNLRFYSDLYKVKRQKADANIEYYLRAFNLWELRDSSIGGFSRGMRQKLALCRCLIHEPKVLFMDEPTSGLDPESACMVRDSIKALKKEGRTIFMCTHNLDEAERLCDRIAIINRHLLDLGTPQTLKSMVYGRKIVVKLERLRDSVIKALSGIRAIKHFETSGDKLVLEVENPEMENADIINNIVKAGGRIQFVSELGHSLEDVYLKRIGEKYEHGCFGRNAERI